ncbi:uncharacterized protein LOC9647000 [Selaginella moellendorffii]|uniref:uncharacterized protein LOC9647000 n=1 Tax=Selaginella moellendorffii TaxID=88036 RepID=UPI000D1C775A|nr:uncharacterized protein LOC9647000 [Selaginella moellendorffii]|eukprot:XP_024541835.1 uncharacterized protein LOC9647000 [Selaginella moellendorffii]
MPATSSPGVANAAAAAAAAVDDDDDPRGGAIDKGPGGGGDENHKGAQSSTREASRRLPPSAFLKTNPIYGAATDSVDDRLTPPLGRDPPAAIHGVDEHKKVPRASLPEDPFLSSAARRSGNDRRAQEQALDPVSHRGTVFDPGDAFVVRLAAAAEKQVEMEKHMQRITEFGMRRPGNKHSHRIREVENLEKPVVEANHSANSGGSHLAACVHDSDAKAQNEDS